MLSTTEDKEQEARTKTKTDEKSALRRRKHCALAVVRWSQKFSPAADPLPGAQDSQNLVTWRWSPPSPINSVWWGSMHAISCYRGNRPTDKQTHTHTQTDRGDYNTLCRSFANDSVINQF